MSLLDKASLVQIPSGYKATKLYSVVPDSGVGDLSFARSSSGTRVNDSGIIETIAIDTPRLDYLGGGCGSLLLEPQRTNLITYSESFDNAYWTKSNSSVVSGFTSPDGNTNAFKLVEDTSTAVHSVFRNSSTVTLDSYSFSCFAKTNGRNLKLDFYGGVNNAIFNLTSGVVVSTNGTGLTAKIETFSNGWYRCSVTQVQTLTTIYPNILCVDGSNNSNYTGDGTSGVYIYGAQLEQGSYSTSIIPTSGATSTRTQDTSSTTGLSSLINSTEGVLFAEIAVFEEDLGNANNIISISDGTSDNRIIIYFKKNESNNIAYGIESSDTPQFFTNIQISNITNLNKIAFKYKLNDCQLWVNGVKLDTETSVSMPNGLNKLSFTAANGTAPFFGKVKNLQIYKTALTDTELATLTTL